MGIRELGKIIFVNAQHDQALEIYIYQASLLIPRLERITPDSSWAHRATGIRRTLLRLTTEKPPNFEQLHAITQEGFRLLE